MISAIAIPKWHCGIPNPTFISVFVDIAGMLSAFRAAAELVETERCRSQPHTRAANTANSKVWRTRCAMRRDFTTTLHFLECARASRTPIATWNCSSSVSLWTNPLIMISIPDGILNKPLTVLSFLPIGDSPSPLKHVEVIVQTWRRHWRKRILVTQYVVSNSSNPIHVAEVTIVKILQRRAEHAKKRLKFTKIIAPKTNASSRKIVYLIEHACTSAVWDSTPYLDRERPAAREYHHWSIGSSSNCRSHSATPAKKS